jgi:hypothetical protein
VIFAIDWVFEPVGFQKIYFNLRYELEHTWVSMRAMQTISGVNDYHGDMTACHMRLPVRLSYLVDLKLAERKKGKSTSKIGMNK